MISIYNFLEQAITQQASDLLLQSEIGIKMKVNQQWKVLEVGQMYLNHWVREQFFALMSEEQRQEFISEGKIRFKMIYQNQEIQVASTISTAGLFLHFHFKPQLNAVSFDIPSAVCEVLKRGTGLSLVTGAVHSGKNLFIRHLTRQLVENQELNVGLFVDDPEFDFIEPDHAYFKSSELFQLSQFGTSMELLIVESMNTNVWRKAVELSEYGFKVVLVLPFIDVQQAILRLSEKIDVHAEQGFQRLIQNLQFAIGLQLIPGIEKKMVSSFELIFNTSEVKTLLRNKDWSSLNRLLKSAGETVGMRTLNQSLLEHMLKRRIEMKAAFLASPDPDELDQLLEQVGV